MLYRYATQANPAVGCRYFRSCLQLPSQFQNVTVFGLYLFTLLDEQGHMCVNFLPVVAVRDHHGLFMQLLDR